MSLVLPGPEGKFPGLLRRMAHWRWRGAPDRRWNEADFDDGPPDLEDLLAAPPPVGLQRINYVIVALLLTLVALASILQVDMIVVAPGRLVTDSPPLVVQPLERAIIRELRVKAGDVVRKGDVLATLDPTFTEADRTALSTQQRALRAQVARIEAELNGTAPAVDRTTPEGALELTLYEQRKAQYVARLQAFDQSIAGYTAGINGAEENRASLAQEITIAKDIETMRASLVEKEVGSRLSYLGAQATRMRTERELQDVTDHQTGQRHALATAEAERQAFIDEWQRQLLEDLERARTQGTQIEEGLTKAVHLDSLVRLTAPADGVVLEVARRSVGSVLHEAEPLITLVPSDVPLIAEVMIASGDVGYAKIGDEAVIKVDAFPYQRHGRLEGRLRVIGEDSFSPGLQRSIDGMSDQAAATVVHRGEIELSKNSLDLLPVGTRLIPGMTVRAEIKVGQRRIISYFLYPLERGFSESIKEP